MENDLLTAKATATLEAYKSFWADRYANAVVIGVEQEFTFPLINPETNGISRTFECAGKIDAIIREAGQIKVVEHKTTSESIASDADYWLRWTMDTQTSQYFISLKAQGIQPDCILCDAIHRPGLQATAVPVLDDDGLKIILNAAGQRVMTKDGKRWKQSKTEDGETIQTRPMGPNEYQCKIANAIAAEPARYFNQREIGRSDNEILEYMQDAWAISQEILYRRRYDLWPRNPQACTQWGGCEYFDLCAGRAGVDNLHYYKAETDIHAELSTEVQQGKDLLTASRISAIRRCPRYHALRYEQHVLPVAEPSEALSFGRMVHEGLEQWFKEMRDNA